MLKQDLSQHLAESPWHGSNRRGLRGEFQSKILRPKTCRNVETLQRAKMDHWRGARRKLTSKTLQDEISNTIYLNQLIDY